MGRERCSKMIQPPFTAQKRSQLLPKGTKGSTHLRWLISGLWRASRRLMQSIPARVEAVITKEGRQVRKEDYEMDRDE
jgi:hypothetical protein